MTGRAPLALALGFTLAGLAWSFWMAAYSNGTHHDDDLCHLQIARWSWDFPQYLLHEWGRPGFTVLYAIPAQLGWLPARLFSGILTAATALLAYDVARRQKVELAPLAAALVWLQPMVFTLSYTTLTETVMGFYLALAMSLFLRQRYAWSAAIVALAPLTRHEGVLFCGLWLVALLSRRRPPRDWLWLTWAVLAHNVLSAIFLDDIPLVRYLRPTATDEYGSGTWWTMLTRWGVAAGGATVLLAIAGAPRTWRRSGGMLWITCGAAYFLAHTLFFRFGLFASGGYERFLVPIAPIVAVAAADALSAAWAAICGVTARRSADDGAHAMRDVRRGLLLVAVGAALFWYATFVQTPASMLWLLRMVTVAMGAAIFLSLACLALTHAPSRVVRAGGIALCPLLLAGLVVAQPILARGVAPPYQQCAPLMLGPTELALKEAADWLKSQGLDRRYAITTNIWFDEFLDIRRSPVEISSAERFANLRPGDLIIWDRRYGPSSAHHFDLQRLQSRRDFREIWHGSPHPYEGVFCYVFEKIEPPASSRPTGSRQSAP
ncbi:hypothetical protein RAS1_40430 [Phycisphaerae bacterium RAS1]|nr:hypothetical protein RAS1_40430 [Phycisphaerae bacterium RAS1]